MNLIDFIPMFIRQDENMRPKGVVTAARWNELWDLAILQGDHSEEAIQTLVAEVLNRYTKLESDALLAGNTNDLVKTVDVNLTTGVITITKKDGTITTFDTALEKVPATFEIIESAGKYYLKITNVDGTTSQTDLTNLMDVYNYNNTATVSFVKSGTGNVKTITAEVRDASIGLEKLSITAISQIESWANTATNGAATATAQANTATTKATEAAASAVTASSKATEASGSAQTATNKAGEASTSAANALSSANSAAASASTATTKASEAAASATAANTSKNQAATSATNAATSEANALVSKNAASASATDANTKATAAATSATNANNSANAAADSAASAAGSASTATTKAGEADASADAAALSAASAQGIDTLSRSYAVGGTGTRAGEDTDNAKYYKDQAQIIVGGDYVTQTELTNGLATKVDTVAGKRLSTEDYTTAEKTKLGTVATNANNYVHPTTAGNKHIPTGGSVGQILKNTASGTATWQAEYSHPTTAGNKHIPSGGSSGKILVYSADGTAVWGSAPPSVTIANNLTETVAGKALDATQGKVLNDIISTKLTKADLEKGIPATMTYNSTPNDGKVLRLLHGDNTTPTTDGVTPSVYIQRVDQSVSGDDSTHLIPSLYVAMKRKSGGTGWLYGSLNYLEDQSNTGVSQSVATAGMAYASANSQIWGVYGDALKTSTLATITGAEFDVTNSSGVDDLYNYASPLISGHSKGVWIASGGANKNSFGLGIGGAGNIFGCGIFLAYDTISDYGIDIQARPTTLINFKNGAKAAGGIGLDCGSGASFGNGKNQGAIHLRSHALCYADGGYIMYNPSTHTLDIGVQSADGTRTVVRSIDILSAYKAL